VTPEAVALLLDTLRLRGGPDAESLRARWARVPTKGLRALAEYEGVALWLHRRLQEIGALPPASFREKLRRAALLNGADNARIDAQALSVLSRLEGAGFRCALIKGQARRAAVAHYPYADARPLSDVDLLVPEAEADGAWNLLCATGFRRIYEDTVAWKADHHRPTIIDDSEVSVELHTTTGDGVPAAEAWRRATQDADTVEWQGRYVHVPNATELLWQALSHAVSDGTRGFRLRTFHSMAVVLASQAEIDWAVVAERIVTNEIRGADRESAAYHEHVREILGIAAGLAGVRLPAGLAPRVVPDLTRLLLWRARVLSSKQGESVRDRLLEEALRVEAHLPLTPATPGYGFLRGFRRRGASAVARVAYYAWRARAAQAAFTSAAD
jgi:hypothetical protein